MAFQGTGTFWIDNDGQSIGNVENFQLAEPKMTDLDKMLDILGNQVDGNCDYKYSTHETGQYIDVGVVVIQFNDEGRFVRIFSND